MVDEPRCEMLLEDNRTQCGEPASRFIITTFGNPAFGIDPWKCKYWFCDEHYRRVSEDPPTYWIDGEPAIVKVLKEEF